NSHQRPEGREWDWCRSETPFEDGDDVAGFNQRLPVGPALHGLSVALAHDRENVVNSAIGEPPRDRHRRHNRHSGLVRVLPGPTNLAQNENRAVTGDFDGNAWVLVKLRTLQHLRDCLLELTGRESSRVHWASQGQGD